MNKVITIGEILVEIMAAEINQPLNSPGKLLGPYPSGAPAIFIDQVGKMNTKCKIISAVGKDDFGYLNLQRLSNDGVDISDIVIKKDHTTGTAFVTYFSDGNRQFIYHFKHSAAGQLSINDLDKNKLKNFDYLHIMGCSLNASKKMRNTIIEAVNFIKDKEILLSFDPNLRPELLEDEDINSIFLEILSESDIILTGRDEISNLLNKSVDGCLKWLKSKGNKTIVLRNGTDVVDVYDNNNKWSIRPPDIEEVDPTGAGDSFDGAFIASLAKGYQIEKCLKNAIAAGALSVQKKGPMEGVSTEEKINEFINVNL